MTDIDKILELHYMAQSMLCDQIERALDPRDFAVLTDYLYKCAKNKELPKQVLKIEILI